MPRKKVFIAADLHTKNSWKLHKEIIPKVHKEKKIGSWGIEVNFENENKQRSLKDKFFVWKGKNVFKKLFGSVVNRKKVLKIIEGTGLPYFFLIKNTELQAKAGVIYGKYLKELSKGKKSGLEKEMDEIVIEEREKEFMKNIQEQLKKNDRVGIIIGAHHVNRMKKKLEDKGIEVEQIDYMNY